MGGPHRQVGQEGGLSGDQRAGGAEEGAKNASLGSGALPHEHAAAGVVVADAIPQAVAVKVDGELSRRREVRRSARAAAGQSDRLAGQRAAGEHRGGAAELGLQGLDGEVVAIHPKRAAEALVDRLHRPVVGLARQAGAEQSLVVEALVAVGGHAPLTAQRVGQGRDLIEHQPLAWGHPVGSAARRPAEAEVVGVRRVVVDQVAEAPAQLHGVLGTVPGHAEGLGAIGAAVEDPRERRFALAGIAEPLAGGVAEDLQIGAFGAALHAAHRQVEVAVEVDVAPAGHGTLQAGKGNREPLEAAATPHQRVAQQLGGEQAGVGVLAAEQQIHIAVVVDIGPGG